MNHQSSNMTASSLPKKRSKKLPDVSFFMILSSGSMKIIPTDNYSTDQIRARAMTLIEKYGVDNVRTCKVIGMQTQTHIVMDL